MRKLPFLNGIRAFEAAARAESFAKAAGELHVTPAAVSRMVQLLEQRIGVPLFERKANRLGLTAAGRAYQAGLSPILDQLANLTAQVTAMAGSRVLTVGVGPTFATRWLIPRLKRFQDKHPHITVHMAERMDPFILAGSGFDAAIHFEHPAWAGMRVHRLLEEVLVPVCSPVLLADAGASLSLDELPRLHRRQNPDAWQLYAQETGIVLTNSAIGARYDLHSMLIAAALAGLGVALVPRLYVGAELEQGRLVAPWPDGQAVAKNFCLVLPEPIELSEAPLQAFAKWILHEARGSAS